MKLDSKDKAILEILQHDATLSIQEIGDRVALSANPCWRRIRHMEEAGIIERRVAVVNPAALGLAMTVFVSIRISAHDRGWLDRFAAAIRTIPEIVECHRMSGDVDYLLKMLVRDIRHYDRVYQRLISEVPGLSDVSSTFSMEQMKATPVPVNAIPAGGA